MESKLGLDLQSTSGLDADLGIKKVSRDLLEKQSWFLTLSYVGGAKLNGGKGHTSGETDRGQ